MKLPLSVPLAGRARSLLRLGRNFPWGPPSWPEGVERPPVEPRTGLDFDTQWARHEGLRYLRGAFIELVMTPSVAALASPQIGGLDRLNGLNEATIFAANHRSHLDTPLLLCALPERFRHRTVVAAAADYFFDSRIKGTLSALALNAIPLDRSRVSRRSADLAASVLDDGWSLVIFPEGGRSPTGWGQEFRGGAAYLSQRCGRPVVPVYIEGTRRILPKGATRPKPATVYIIFGKPLRLTEGEDTRRFASRIERAVAALADEQATDWWQACRRAAVGLTPPLTGPPAGAWRRAWALGELDGRWVGRPGQRRAPAEPRWP